MCHIPVPRTESNAVLRSEFPQPMREVNIIFSLFYFFCHLVMTVLFFAIIPIQKMVIFGLPWQIRMKHLLLLVVILDLIPSPKPKSSILRLTHGQKLLIIRIIQSKFKMINGNIFKPKSYFSIRLYATVTTSQGALIIGGYCSFCSPDYYVATVASYNENGWKQLDDLQSTRYAHRAIVNGDKVFVIGGSGTE